MIERDLLAADLAWLADYLPAHYPIGRPDIGGRICIGGSCGATFAEAVRKARLAFDGALADSIMRDMAPAADRGGVPQLLEDER